MFLRRESFKQYISWYPVTTALISINILMMMLMAVFGSVGNVETMLRFGALYELYEFKAEWWRYVTATFLHGSWEHLLFNCFALLVFAPPLERMLGHWRYAVYYLFCGVSGSVVSALIREQFISLGASGAIYGIYAGYIFLALFRKDIFDAPSRKTIIIIVIVGFLYSIIVPRIDLWAHLGGFLGGLLAMMLIVMSIRRRYR